MNEWFHDAFTAHYMSLYAHRDEDEARQTVELINKATPFTPGIRILDAPCGAGRHARVFAVEGGQVTGLDLSQDLLNHAQSEVQQEGITSIGPGHLKYVRADLRNLPFAQSSFDLVVNLFSSFGYFVSECENLRALAELTRVCRLGGHVVIDFFNAEKVRAGLQSTSSRTTSDGWLVTEERGIHGSPPRVEKRTRIESTTGEVKEVTESVRLYEPDELIELMERAGVAPICRYGDYEGNPLQKDSPRIFLIGKRTR